MRLIRSLLPTLALTLCAAGATAGQVRVVDDDGGAGVFVELQAAVDAAAEGDVLLVKPGSYTGAVIDGKSLVVVAESAGTVRIEPAFGQREDVLTVRNLSPRQQVTLRGLFITSMTGVQDVLRLENCGGSIWVESCAVDLSPQVLNLSGGPPQEAVAVVQNCASVSFTRCVLAGLAGIGAGFFGGTDAGPGMRSVDSHVAVHDSLLLGGAGFDGFMSPVDPLFPGGPGGAAMVQEGGSLFLSGSTLIGGAGGDGVDYLSGLCTDGGDGGAALLLVGAAPAAEALDTFLQGGSAGATGGQGCVDGADGAGIDPQTGSGTVLPGKSGSLTIASPLREGEASSIELLGSGGDAVWIALSASQDFRTLAGLLVGVVLVEDPVLIRAGNLSSGGALSISISTPMIPALSLGETFYLQPVLVSPGSGPFIRMGAPSALTILDSGL